MVLAPLHGFEVAAEDINPLAEPHQRDIIQWMVRGGRRGAFANFGLGKSLMQIEVLRLLLTKLGGRHLIVCPLGVRQEFVRDGVLDTPAFRRRAEKLGLNHQEIVERYGVQFRFVRRDEDLEGDGLYLTNYESVRDGKLNPKLFTSASLDEASVLRGFGGTKTFREFMRLFDGMKYKFVATATPSPNEYIELLAYAAFLEIIDVGQGKTRFFKRDSTHADKLTLHPHKEHEFWLWCASWAIFLQKPSDLGYSDEGYDLPGLDIHWHEIPSDYSNAGVEPSGQGRLIKDSTAGVVEAAREKRDSLPARIEKMLELRATDPGSHRIIWHDLEAERHAIEKAIPDVASIWGSGTTAAELERREQKIIDFSDGVILELATKPSISGSGCNLQRHCAWEIFLGIGFKFNDFIQAIHRTYRFLQDKRVRIDLIYTEAERGVREVLERKWRQHEELMVQMRAVIQQYGLAHASIASSLQRSIGVDRREESGADWKLVNNDAVLETLDMPAESVHFILTSIPFATQYEYTPSYNDFGHTDSNDAFWKQMDFLTPELLRVLKPGRLAAIHVKDRIVPGGVNGLGFQTVYRFSDACCDHFEKHGFAFMGRKTIVTDVVRENNQTYRLGWTEQCKDGTKMGFGMPEYLLLFRHPTSDSSNGYADEPVMKAKGHYTRSRWQIDAHGFARSSGDRLLTVEDLGGLKHHQIFKLYRKYSESNVYDFERHVAMAESLERCQHCGHIHTGNKCCGHVRAGDQVGSAETPEPCPCRRAGGRLPLTFMLFQPASWSDEVWSDVTRMMTLNTAQSAGGREGHLCPLQFDIADRAITQFTMPGEIVYDPFAGLGTVPDRALLLGRQGWGVELNARYFYDAVQYLTAAERKVSTPTLFDIAFEEAV
ncbi:MAG TPA: DNA methyltransferase [Polyangia bacterium]|nr:DNA methyltransferase [Polyangia bacterium]